MTGEPRPLSDGERVRRLERIVDLSAQLGFVGSVEYRHVYSQSGGAQYCIGPTANDDIMIIYAEAFERDADPEDFPLESVVAHECGHQRLNRDPKFQEVMRKFGGEEFEEILSSLVGCVLLGDGVPARLLLWRAIAELGDRRISTEEAIKLAERLMLVMEKLL